MRIGYIKSDGLGPSEDDSIGVIRVGALDPNDPLQYDESEAIVYADDTWLYIETDEYQGHARLRIEALPFLQQALRMVGSSR